ncbi:toxin YdaT family protein [Kosakonia sacchari]|uniref:toxin YdaT family protein n=1 Tax=Kosakonia sacchari TaxID=1158459 RepID=UPI001584D6CA|nr:toxin YdaT family protein [Kosakonia sacchari]NUL36603.1 hypothetical protein [Kosakonia sacchari]
MKLNPPVNAVAAALESRALEISWKSLGLAVAEAYHAAGGGSVLPALDSEEGLKNAVQRVKRIFRGCDSRRYAPLAESLLPAALAALPIEIRVSIESPGDPVLLAAQAARESIEAVSAVNLGATPGEMLKEINDAIEAFISLKKSLSMTGLRLCP